MMKNKLVIFALALSIFLISVGCAYAENETVMDDPGLNNEGSFTDLQNEINAAGDEISLNRNYTYNPQSDANYTNGIIINKNIQINGNGYTLNGNSQSRIFNVTAGNSVLNNIVFTNGYAKNISEYFKGSGSAIHSKNWNYNVNNCTFINNGERDAIYRPMNVSNSIFKSNNGGALSEAKNSVVNCGFFNNNGYSISGAKNVIGCIFANNTDKVYDAENIADCIFFNNTGGVDAADSITDCMFINNIGNEGGAISYAYSKIRNCTFINNTAIKGGAIANSMGSIENCTFINNHASSLGGAVYSYDFKYDIINCIFINNSADAGGALHNPMSVLNSTFSNNTAGKGGAIYYDENYNVNVNNEFSIAESAFIKNTAGDGGAVYLYGDLKCNILACEFEKNSADNRGGAIYVNDGYSTEGSIAECNFSYNTAPDMNNFKDSWAAIYCEGDSLDVANCTFIKEKTVPEINITAQDIKYGKDLTVNIQLPEYVKYRPTVSVANQSQLVSLKNGAGTVKFSGLSAGTQTVQVSYNGDSNYLKASANMTVAVLKITPKIEITANAIYLGEDLIVNVRMPEDISRRPTVTVGNESEIVTMRNDTGTARFSGLDVGTHTVKVSYNGDENYLKASSSTRVKVNNPAPEIKVSADDIAYGKDLVVNVLMPLDATRRPMVTVKGVSKAVSIKNGTGTVKFQGLEAGTYNIWVTYNGDANYSKTTVSTTVNVNKAAPAIKLTARSVQYGNVLTVEVKMPKDIHSVTLKVGDETKTVNVNDTKATVNFTGLKAGSYIIEAAYEGDSNYLKASANKTVKVTRAVAEIQVAAEDIKAGQTLKVAVKLPGDVSRRAIVSVGDESKTVTLKNGEANVNFSGLTVGLYEVKVSYAGDVNYKASENSTMINVK